MALSAQTTPSGYLLPSIHLFPPFFTLQKNTTTQATSTGLWSQLILSYARHRRLFVLRLEDAEDTTSPWAEVLRNERINRRVRPEFMAFLLAAIVSRGEAAYDPPAQTHSVLLYWRTPEAWGELLHEWASSTGQLNTILTFYEITSAEVDSATASPAAGMPLPLLRRSIASLAKSNRAQIIGAAEGEGVRFFVGAR